MLQKRIIYIFLIMTCIALSLSGCSPKTPSKSLDLVETNSELNYFKFPKTDWGMSPQEVMGALGLTINDVTIKPQISNPNLSLSIQMVVNKGFKLLDKPVTNVTFDFVYLMISGVGEGELGLTRVTSDFGYEDFEFVKDAVQKTFGDESGLSMISSKGNFGTLPEKTRESIIDVFSKYEGYIDFNEQPEKLPLSGFEFQQTTEEPYLIKVIYTGYFAAIANTDYSDYHAARNAFNMEHGITN